MADFERRTTELLRSLVDPNGRAIFSVFIATILRFSEDANLTTLDDALNRFKSMKKTIRQSFRRKKKTTSHDTTKVGLWRRRTFVRACFRQVLMMGRNAGRWRGVLKAGERLCKVGFWFLCSWTWIRQGLMFRLFGGGTEEYGEGAAVLRQPVYLLGRAK